MNEQIELREWTRIPKELIATLEVNGNQYNGSTRNVSANGVLIEGIPVVEVATTGTLELSRSDNGASLVIRANCEVVRSDANATAVRLVAYIGEESYAHMRNLITYNAGPNADKAEGEFRNHVGLIRRD